MGKLQGVCDYNLVRNMAQNMFVFIYVTTKIQTNLYLVENSDTFP
jgi:hypothetical protein